MDTGLFEEDEVCDEEEGALDSPESHLGLQGGSVDHILLLAMRFGSLKP